MAISSKRPSALDGFQTLKQSFIDNISTLSVDGFVTSKVGHRIERSVETTTITNDTEVFQYFDENILICELTIIYTDGSREELLSVERTA